MHFTSQNTDASQRSLFPLKQFEQIAKARTLPFFCVHRKSHNNTGQFITLWLGFWNRPETLTVSRANNIMSEITILFSAAAESRGYSNPFPLLHFGFVLKYKRKTEREREKKWPPSDRPFDWTKALGGRYSGVKSFIYQSKVILKNPGCICCTSVEDLLSNWF